MEVITAQKELQFALETFEKYGIEAKLNSDNLIVISHYSQPKDTTFSELGIDENALIKNVVACEGRFDLRNSKITEFPLIVAKEIRLYPENEITQMPNLKVVGFFVSNEKLKKLPKLKTIGLANFESSMLKTLPKLKEAGLLIIQNSLLKEIPNLERVQKICIIDTQVVNLKELKEAQEIFICSSDEQNKIELKSLPKLENVENLFVANSQLKTLPNLKSAKKIALYNCEIRSLKQGICKEVEIQKQISDEELSEKFDTFTDWYNSDILNKSMDLLGNIVNHIKD